MSLIERLRNLREQRREYGHGLNFAVEGDDVDVALDEAAAELEANAAEIGRLREALEKARDTLMYIEVESGYCCCGSPIEGHSIGDGHSPVDADQYAVQQTIECIDAVIGLGPLPSWIPHLDYAGEEMWPGELRDPPQEKNHG